MSKDNKSVQEVKDKVCDYYLSARGCVKGDECDHLHPVAPNGEKTNRVCDFYGSPKGCSKGEECGFLHVKRLNPLGEECNRVCDFFLTSGGCIKGMQCNFLHPRAVPANKQRQVFQNQRSNSSAGAGGANNDREQRVGSVTVKGSAVLINGDRVCEYYLTPTGCSKGSECRYLHPRGKEAQDALKAKEIANKNKTQRRATGGARVASAGGAKGGAKKGPKRGATEKSAEDKKNTPCSFFKTAAGCKKGNECDFSHE